MLTTDSEYVDRLDSMRNIGMHAEQSEDDQYSYVVENIVLDLPADQEAQLLASGSFVINVSSWMAGWTHMPKALLRTLAQHNPRSKLMERVCLALQLKPLAP